VSDDIGFPHNHEEVAWGHWLAQHVGKVNTENFVRSFYGPLNVLDGVLEELYTERGIDTATGNALDGIGSIVGISRNSPFPVYLEFFGFVSQPAGRAFGVAKMRRFYEPYLTTYKMLDEEYRVAIKCKISLNNGHGTAEEIMHAFDTALGIEGTQVFDQGNATGHIVIPKPIDSTNAEYYMIQQMIPGAAGVKWYITLTYPDFVFGFESQPKKYGFGVGVMANRLV
jgi:hypothetical protein